MLQLDFKLQGDPKRPKNFKKCNNPMIFRELILDGFGILVFEKCQVCGILPFEDLPIHCIRFKVVQRKKYPFPK